MTVSLDPHGPDLTPGPGRASVRARRRLGGVRAPLVAPLALGLAVLAGTAYLGVTDPYRPGGHLVCPVHALTGLWCAGCGGQRAVHELTQLDVAAAWGMNPLVVLLVPVAVLAWARWLGRSAAVARGGPPSTGPRTPVRAAASVHAPWLLLVVVAAFAVLRNLPALAPWLAP